MAKRRVSEIVRQRQGLRQIFVEAEGAGDRAGDLRDFEAVGQAGPVMVALVIDEDLCLVLEAPEGARMDDAVAVALKRRAHLVLGLRVEATATVFRVRRIGRTGNRPNHGPTLRPPGAGVYPKVGTTLTQAVVRQRFLIWSRAAVMCSG